MESMSMQGIIDPPQSKGQNTDQSIQHKHYDVRDLFPAAVCSSALASMRSISARISRRLFFNVLKSSNFLCAFASSTNVSSSASCSRRGCRTRATSESGSMIWSSGGAGLPADGDTAFLGFGRV